MRNQYEMGVKLKGITNQNILDLMPDKSVQSLEETLKKYGPERVVRLASNENPFPVPRNVSEAIKSEISSLNLYPDSGKYCLQKRISEYNRVRIGNVVLGPGSAEITRIIVVTYLKPGEKVLIPKSTFPFYKIAAVQNGGKDAIVETGLDNEYRIDLDEMLRLILRDEKIKIIFIANPNNPTGTILSKTKLQDFIDQVPENRIIVLDNAYQEYVMDPDNYLDGIDLALNRKNIIVLRTFSKIYALAGLRIGYGISNKETISYLQRAVTPYCLTSLSQKAAFTSLENDDFRDRSAALNRKNMEILYKQLSETGIKVIPSAANFLSFFPEVDIKDLYDRLIREGVLIAQLQPFGIPDGMRVTIGTEEDNSYFVEKLKKIL
ncbi:MAG: histidinol-phosphate transaminase [Deltaproteobacteria bacterium]|nr:histidinol-phosphate transaminase [Deltaproteobacteria bacterium]